MKQAKKSAKVLWNINRVTWKWLLASFLTNLKGTLDNKNVIEKKDADNTMGGMCDQRGNFKENSNKRGVCAFDKKERVKNSLRHNDERGTGEFNTHKLYWIQEG